MLVDEARASGASAHNSQLCTHKLVLQPPWFCVTSQMVARDGVVVAQGDCIMTKGLAQRPDNELFFREWLRTQRMRRGFSVEQLARALDSSSSLYDDYERGEAQIPPPLFGRIANLLGAAVPFLSNEGFHELQDTDELASSGDPSVFRVATTEERAQRARRTASARSTSRASSILLAIADGAFALRQGPRIALSAGDVSACPGLRVLDLAD